MVCGDELDEIFRIELLAERSRFDEIAEEDREMPALRVRMRSLLLGDGLWFHCSPPWARDQNTRALNPVLLAQLSHVWLFTHASKQSRLLGNSSAAEHISNLILSSACATGVRSSAFRGHILDDPEVLSTTTRSLASGTGSPPFVR